MPTTSTIKPINFREVYFPRATLTKITGYPTYSDLQALSKQVKANAASVPSTLGGGNHGHLGLVTDATTYGRVSQIAYVRPVLPAALTAATQGMTQH